MMQDTTNVVDESDLENADDQLGQTALAPDGDE
jgi:hypothetical protein